MAVFEKGFLSVKGWKGLLVLVCIWVCGNSAWAQSGWASLKEKVSGNFYHTNVATVLQSLQEQTSYTFTFDNGLMQGVVVDSLVVKNGTLGEILQQLHDRSGLLFSLMPNKNIGVQKGKEAMKQKHVTGQVLDQKSGLPVGGATVSAGEVKQATDLEGKFSLPLKPGKYIVEISFIGYQGKRITDVVVEADDAIINLDVLLTPQAGTLSGVMVSAGMRKESVAALYVKQKNNVAISDGISAEQIRATADNNAAQVLKRVSGVVVQNDKFITIRGMSDRYNNVLINGAMLPSTEPNRRNFSFDIVPSASIDNIVINKTASPDMPSEFSGGFVQINTRDVPVRNFLDVTIGSGFNAASSGQMMMDHKRLGSDYLGAKGKDRTWYGTILQGAPYIKALYSDDLDYTAKVGSQIPNRWKYYQYGYAPVQNYQLAGGMIFRLKHNSSLGFTSGATYRNEQFVEKGEKRNISNADYRTERYRFTTTIGGIANLAFKTANHKLAFKNLYNRRFSSQFDYDNGRDFNTSDFVRNTTSNVLVNEIILNRLEGEHIIGRNLFRVDWFADVNRLTRDQPDTRYIRGVNRDEEANYSYNFKERPIIWGALFASALKETRKNAGVNVSVPFSILKNAQQIKAGYSFSDRKADYNGTGFRVLDVATDGIWATKQAGLPYDVIVSQQNLLAKHLTYYPTYNTNDNSTGDGYSGEQKLDGVYVMGDFRIMQQLRITGGLRYENNRIKMNTAYMLKSGADSVTTGNLPAEKSWLPSVNLIYNISPKMNFRASYGETLARPDFVERSPFIYYDFPEQLFVYGNYGIKTTTVKNYDARIEYYPSGSEVASVSFFYKDFTNPVERFFIQGNPSNSVEYANLDKAYVRGVEVDIRKSLSFIGEGSFLRNLYVSGNFSYLKGRIETYAERLDTPTNQMKRVKVESDRPVQGLSPYVLNLGLNYQSKIAGFNIGYNRFGRRIIYGGTQEGLVQYENPRDVLDLQLNFWLIKQKMELRLNAADILNQPFIIYSNATNDANGGSSAPNTDPQGIQFNPDVDFVNYKVKRGANYSFVLTYKF